MHAETYIAIAERVEADSYGADQVRQYRGGYAFPDDPDALVREAAWVILGANVQHKGARTMQRHVDDLLAKGAPLDRYPSAAKAQAIEHVGANRDGLYAALWAAHKAGNWALMEWHLSHVPFLRGPALSRHFLKNLGADVAKPDTHLTRIARHSGETVDDLCDRLARESGDRVCVVDVVLFLAAGPLGVIDSADPTTWPAGEGEAA